MGLDSSVSAHALTTVARVRFHAYQLMIFVFENVTKVNVATLTKIGTTNYQELATIFVPTKSDSDVMFSLQLLSITLPFYLHLS